MDCQVALNCAAQNTLLVILASSGKHPHDAKWLRVPAGAWGLTFKCMLITAAQLLAAQCSLNMLCSPRRRRWIVLDTIKRAPRYMYPQPLLVQRKLLIDTPHRH